MIPALQTLREFARRHKLRYEDVYDEFTERAGIRQHDGGMAREDAEVAAMQDVVERFVK